jgi:Coenzyme PQQ synthesis protein D (PqqD)
MAIKSSIEPHNFRQRYAIEWVAEGGLLVDMTTGNYFRLNSTAAEICRALFESTSTSEITRRLADRLRIAPQEADGLLRSMEIEFQTLPPREEPFGPFRYVLRENFYDLVENDRPILTVDSDGKNLRLCSSLQDLNYPIVDYLRAIAPKIVRLHGIPILHASACIFANGALTGFSGKSGAGKTTTALAFRAAGAGLISEDLMVLSATGSLEVYLEGERSVHAWSARVADELLEKPNSVVNCEELLGAARGPTAPLSAIWFVDTARRSGVRFQLRRLSEIEGFIALLGQSFLAATDPESLRRHLRHTRRLTEEVTLIEASAPAGLENLTLAARDQSANSAS